MRFTVGLALAATLALWSGNWIVARAMRDDISPGFATGGRLIVVLAILLPLTLSALWKKLPLLRTRDWTILAALGLSGGGPHLAMQWLGLHHTTATNGILYLSTVPIFILLLAPFTGERIRAAQWIGVLISFCGIAAIAAHGDPARLAALSFNKGDTLALGSMAMWACYTVLLRMRRDRLEIVELLTVVCAFGLVYMLPWLAYDLAYSAKFELSRNAVLAIVYSAFGSLLLAYAAWSYVVTRLGAARAGVTLHLMPAMGVVLAAIFLGEYPQWYHFAGIALILAGVGLSSWQRRAS